ncbi:MAG TPA: Lrp/AsnC ligand binding domain-containing protein [Methanotrichaceae archaeon]|nr:Lrp/AsnC ligand binding domain-containing protein [Methanotrichaceae archaeon]
MTVGVVMVKAAPGQERSAYYGIKSIEGVKDIYHTFGEYDFFLIIQAREAADIIELIEKVKNVCNVAGLETVLVGRDVGLHDHQPLSQTTQPLNCT